MPSRRRDRDKKSARGGVRKLRRRLLVVCEGLCTEREYIRGFERLTRKATVEIEIPLDRGEPKTVVEIAKERAEQARLEARRQGDAFIAYDEVWCIFDRDQHERFDDAVTMAIVNRFELAVSNPSVELWLILHFRESPGPQHRDRMEKILSDLLGAYSKHVDFDDYANGVEQAIKRARRLDEDAHAMGEDRRNPTTGFYRLLESIRK